MNFALSDEQKQLQEALDRMVSETASVRRVHQMIDADSGFDESLWDALKEFGIAGIIVPTEHEGLGLELVDTALAAEVLGYHAASVPFLGHVLATLACGMADDQSIKERWLPELAAGRVLGTIALGENGERRAPEQWTLAADKGSIRGDKYFVPAGNEAALVVVGLAGGELGLVLPGAQGIARTPHDVIDRTRRLSRLHFEAFTPVVKLTNEPAKSKRLMDAALALLAADAFGGARRILDLCVSYVGEREQFGMKLGQFQAIKHQLANMVLEIEPSRALYWYAAHAYDRRPNEAAAATALAKSHITERFLQAARDAVEVHGGIGFTWEYHVHIWLKRAMFDWTWAGTPAVHRERYATLMGW